ncbi:hypothetical protein [Corynebacterium anserum]|uniref:hypothetical protein n=1 Tax=Corynebacterium anserum TaxID=2684406 RepID=UPI00163952E0|nr:hypothetical protein [Corynebacterium anserum]
MNIDISIRAINHHTAGELEQTAMSSVFWELPCDATNTPTISEDPYFDKQIWIQRVLMQWGICGYTAYVGTGDEGGRLLPAATVFFAPGSYFPGAMALPTHPVSPDAILISNVFVATPYMGLYLEHQLIDTVLTEARRRGVKAIEAFARVEEGERNDVDIERQSPGDGANGAGEYLYQPEAYGGWKEREQSYTGDLKMDILSTAPLLSEDILESEGFQVVCEHPLYPRYRYELKSTGSLFAHYAADKHSALNENAPLRTVLGGTKKTPQTIGAMSKLKRLLEQHRELHGITERQFDDNDLETNALETNVIESED